MVENNPRDLEREEHDVGDNTKPIHSHNYVRYTYHMGCGHSPRGKWCQLECPESWRGYHNTVKELLPIVLSVALWGGYWQNKTIRCRCNNAAVVSIVNTGMSRCDKVMQLMQSSFLAKHTILLLGIERMLSLEMIGAPFSHAVSRGAKRTHINPCRACASAGATHPRMNPQSWTRSLLVSWLKVLPSQLIKHTRLHRIDS